MIEERAEEKTETVPSQSPRRQTQDAEEARDSMAEIDGHEEKEEEEVKKQKEEERTKEIEKNATEIETPPEAKTSVEKKTLKQEASEAKRKLETSQADAKPFAKNKKARVSASIKSLGAKSKKDTKKALIRTGEFSFARPTASSTSRTAAVIKTTPTPPPARKSSHLKKSPASAQRSSMPAPKTPVMLNKTTRSNLSYTPYTGPLPPLTVQSSFAPKGSQSVGHETPASTKLARKPRPTSPKKAQPGKENNNVLAGDVAVTNAASSSKAKQMLVRVQTRSKLK